MPTDLKKRLDRASQKIAAAVILLGPKKLGILVRSQCEINRHGLSLDLLQVDLLWSLRAFTIQSPSFAL